MPTVLTRELYRIYITSTRVECAVLEGIYTATDGGHTEQRAAMSLALYHSLSSSNAARQERYEVALALEYLP